MIRHAAVSLMRVKVINLPEQEDVVLTDDTLLGGNVRLRQPKEGFRAAIDTVFLAAAVSATSGQKVLELGTGSGAAALCLAQRVDGAQITGIDVNPKAIALANENIELNQRSDNIEVAIVDVADRLPGQFVATFDHVMMNPPYLPDTSSHARPSLTFSSRFFISSFIMSMPFCLFTPTMSCPPSSS